MVVNREIDERTRKFHDGAERVLGITLINHFLEDIVRKW